MNAKRALDTPSAAKADAAPNELTRVLASNLIAARQELGMSQRALAAEAGLSRNYLIRIERGDANVGLGVLMILARVVKKEASDLIKLPQHGRPHEKE